MADYVLSAKITGDATGFEKAFSKAERTTALFESRMSGLTSKLKSIGSSISSAGGKLEKYITKPAFAAASALTGVTLVKGFNRLTGIDEAKAKLLGLGHDAQSVETIMNSALESVKGTSYGLDEAATTAASAVAAGIKPGKELTRYLSLTADAAAIAGASMSDMGSIINKVQTSQIAYTDDLNQLADRGLPIYQWLADEAGVAASEVKKMASEGSISSEMFLNAIEKNIGGAAKIMGENSFKASLANIGASLSRIGANFLDAGGKGGGFFSQLKPLMADFNDKLGGIESKASELGEKFGSAFNEGIKKIEEIKSKFDSLSPGMQKAAVKGTAIASLFAVGLGPGLKVFGKGVSIAGTSLEGLNGISSTVMKGIGGIPASFKSAGSGMKNALKVFANIGDAVTLPFQDLGAKVSPFISQFIDGTADLWKSGVGGKMTDAISSGLSKIGPAISKKFPEITGKLSTFAQSFSQTGSKIMSTMGKWGGQIGGVLGNVAGKISTYGGIVGNSFLPILQKVAGFIPAFAGYMNIAAVAGIIVAGMGLLYSQFGGQIDQLLIMVQTKGPAVITDFANGIIAGLPNLIALGANMIANLMLAITANLPALMSAGIGILSSLITGIANQLPMLMPIAVNMILTLVQSLISNLPKLIDSGLKLLSGFVQGLVNAIPKVVAAVPKIITSLATTLISKAPQILETGMKLIVQLGVGLIKAIPQLVGQIPSIISAVKNKFTSVNWGEVGLNIIKGIASGLKDAAKSLAKAAADAATDALNWVKDKLGIHSPSRVFRDEVGKMMALGMGIGFEDNVPVKMLNKGIDHAMSRLRIADKYSSLGNPHFTQCETNNGGYWSPKTDPRTAIVRYAENTARANTYSTRRNESTIGNSVQERRMEQTVNIYQPVKSPVETARALKKAGRELAFG